ncbi:c-type cytochrome biogenesis protein CcmI [Azorhizobium doebereinerae]|uniref:c-type cytochrome biogenesis protein CcmI n=1 Tax=Azorhizobium doebereinerae TaxID=281091 RepID=UPI00054D7B1B|nr:c-type cytochrome biogenesis protein CcmI [Azorhizobium doebereinerae]
MTSVPLFVAFALMTAVAVMAVLWPLSRARHARGEREADLAVYRDQLAEIVRDQAGGRLSPEQAHAARIEVSRRILAVGGEQAVKESASPGRRRAAAVVALVLIPLLGVGLYARLGSPAIPGAPLAERLSAAADGSDIAILVRRVEEHLSANPNDGQGYEILAPVYARLGRLDDAARAYRQAIRILGPTAEREAALGEVLTAAADGMVTQEAAQAFAAAASMDPRAVKARYYLGLAAEQDGRRADAAAIWSQMLADAPAGAPWRPLLETALARLGVQPPQPATPPLQAPAAPVPPAAATRGPRVAPDAAPGPSSADVAAAAQQTPEQRSAMIMGMVSRLEERLAAEPKDLDGWLRLARAWSVLGDKAKAEAALQSAKGAFAGDEEAGRRIEAARQDLGLGG